MSAHRHALRIVRCDIAGCGLPIIWTRSSTGKAMPIDANPSAQGNVLIDSTRVDDDGRPAAGVLGAEQARGAREHGKELRIHHRLTCVHPEQWARAGRRP